MHVGGATTAVLSFNQIKTGDYQQLRFPKYARIMYKYFIVVFLKEMLEILFTTYIVVQDTSSDMYKGRY